MDELKNNGIVVINKEAMNRIKDIAKDMLWDANYKVDVFALHLAALEKFLKQHKIHPQFEVKSIASD